MQSKYMKSMVVLGLTILAAIILFAVELPDLMVDGKLITLSENGKTVVVILFLAVALWITELVPFAVTGLIAISLLILSNITSISSVVETGFGRPIVIFFISVMIISAGLAESGLIKRISLQILLTTKMKTDKVILAFLFVGVTLSMWVTNMAVAAILVPVAIDILEKIKAVKLQSNFGKGLLISIAWGCAIGGIGTPVGNGANIVTLGYLQEIAGLNITFLDWMKVGVPASYIMLFVSWFLILQIFPPEHRVLNISTDEVADDLDFMDKLKPKEITCLIILALAIILWLTEPLLKPIIPAISVELVALGAAVLLFLPGIEVISWQKAQKYIDWGTIILIAAGLSIGYMLLHTNAADWLAMLTLRGLHGMPIIMQIFVTVIAVELLKILFSSNTVTALIIIPLVITFALTFGIDPWILAGSAAIASSLAFVLVTSSPTNVIPYNAGYFSMIDFIKPGLLLTIISAVIVTMVFYVTYVI